MSSNPWIWDDARQLYYYVDRIRRVYVFSDRSEMAVPTANDSDPTSDTQSRSKQAASEPTDREEPTGGPVSDLSNLALGTSTSRSVSDDTSPPWQQNISTTGGADSNQSDTIQINPRGYQTALSPNETFLTSYQSLSYGLSQTHQPLLGSQPPPSAANEFGSAHHPFEGYAPNTQSSAHDSWSQYNPLNNRGGYGGHRGYSGSRISTTPSARSIPPVHSNFVGSSSQQNTGGQQPSDAEVIQDVQRSFRPSSERIGQQNLLDPNLEPHRWLGPTPGDAESHDPNFTRRYPGWRFFKLGVVFKVLWTDLADDINQNSNIATNPRFVGDGDRMLRKVRWFVVIREGKKCCTCLSIQTYEGRGVPLNKYTSQHAIMYTGPNEPIPLDSEISRGNGDTGLGESIRVIGKHPWNKMDPKSRVYFLKPYTVEHNVKVDEFGKVDARDEEKLISQFNSHWGIPGNDLIPQNSTHAGISDNPIESSNTLHLPRYQMSLTPRNMSLNSQHQASSAQMFHPQVVEEPLGVDERNQNSANDYSPSSTSSPVSEFGGSGIRAQSGGLQTAEETPENNSSDSDRVMSSSGQSMTGGETWLESKEASEATISTELSSAKLKTVISPKQKESTLIGERILSNSDTPIQVSSEARNDIKDTSKAHEIMSKQPASQISPVSPVAMEIKPPSSPSQQAFTNNDNGITIATALEESTILSNRALTSLQVDLLDSKRFSCNSNTYVPSSSGSSRSRPKVEIHEVASGLDTEDGHTLINNKDLEAESDELLNISASYQEGDEHDIQSLISDEDEMEYLRDDTIVSKPRKVEDAVIRILATNSLLAPLHSAALSLMPKERFVNNFGRLLKTLHDGLQASRADLVAKELAFLLGSKTSRRRIAEKVVKTHIFFSLDEDPIPRLNDTYNLEAKLETWLEGIGHGPLAPPVADGDDESITDEENDETHPTEFPRVDHVVKTLIESQPFQDMLWSFKAFLLPPGLLRELSTMDPSTVHYASGPDWSPVGAFQDLVENITALEWDWWPLPTRKRALRVSETRLYWKCQCGTVRWRELSFAQKEILEESLHQSSQITHSHPPICAFVERPRAKSGICQLFHRLAGFSAHAHSSSSSAGQRYTPVQTPPAPVSQPQQAHLRPSSGPASDTTSTSSVNGTNAVTNSVSGIRHWIILGAHGARPTIEMGQIGDVNLQSDTNFLARLRETHIQLRGWLRYLFSIWILKYWDFVKFERLLQVQPCQVIVQKVDLPLSTDYDYSPRPPKVTIDDPGITRHEFEVMVRLCQKSCWLNSWSMIHDCIQLHENAMSIVGRIPKRNIELIMASQDERDKYLWGIQAKYVVSAFRVFIVHLIILLSSVGVWIWWQRKHPSDMQGASVPFTVAGILISTFWGTAGVLHMFR